MVLGTYKEAISARSTEDKILKVSQDGGIVSALLCYALDEGIIEPDRVDHDEVGGETAELQRQVFGELDIGETDDNHLDDIDDDQGRAERPSEQDLIRKRQMAVEKNDSDRKKDRQQKPDEMTGGKLAVPDAVRGIILMSPEVLHCNIIIV